MADVVLINPPIARYDVAELAPPLSLLALAASLRAAGRDAAILDLNLPKHREVADHPRSYFEYVTDQVSLLSPREIGITSMGVNTHVALALAIHLAREVTPHITIGGIHVSTVAASLLSELPPGVRIAPSRNTLSGPEWWNSPLPRYSARELFQLDPRPYFEGNQRRLANLEVGFGCKYKCSFCYSPAAFGEWTNYHISQAVEDFTTLEGLGFRHAFLVGDNLANDPSWFCELTDALSSSSTELTWNGYATLPDLSEKLLECAASARCSNLYVGIDAVSPQQQRTWGKRFLRNHERVFSLLHTAGLVGLQLTCALILDIDPDFDIETATTLQFAAQMARRGADIRLSVITPYPETPLFARAAEAAYAEERTAILMDLPQVVVRNGLAERRPALFPWHSRPRKLAGRVWRERLLAVHAAQVLLNTDLPATSTGHVFWEHCRSIAHSEMELPILHKTELKPVVRRLSAELSRAA